MRDLELRHSLKQLARDASAIFSEIVEDGQEIPYEISGPGEATAISQYRPLTAKFVRDNATELRELESFSRTTELMRICEIAAPYLAEAGINPPADPIERSTLAVTYFLARLWDGCSDFEIDEDRFSLVLGEVEETSEPDAGEIEAIVPLVGFSSEADRIDLHGASIVRAETVDAPPEVSRGADGPNGWQPTFVISTTVVLDEDGLSSSGDRVAKVFDRVITALRLYKRGGVGLGPHGWVRVAGDRWRRINTGAGRTRGGGYRLEGADVEPLAELGRTLAVHTRRVSRLRRPLLRFESGLDRRGAVDALNDYLLALRFMLEGEGPAGVGLPMRAAALAGRVEERVEVKSLIDSAFALERELWSGERPSRAASPSEIALGVEELLRTILFGAVSGEFGTDLRAAADETLLAEGLAVGESSTRGDTTEWGGDDLDEAIAAESGSFTPSMSDQREETGPVEDLEDELEPMGREDAELGDALAAEFERFEADSGAEIVVSRRSDEVEEPVAAEPGDETPSDAEPVAEGEIEPPTEQLEELSSRRQLPLPLAGQIAEDQVAEPVADLEAAEQAAEAAGDFDPPAWLEEVKDEGDDEAMEFPRRANHLEDLARPPMDRDEVRARVEYLFPRTETDWSVGGRAGADTEQHVAAG